MHFDIEATNTDLPLEARAYLEFRVFSALSRFGSRVFAVRIAVCAMPAEGVTTEIRCRLNALLRPVGEAVSEARAERLYAAIDQLAEKAASAVESAIESSVA